MKKDYTVEAVKYFICVIFGIIMTLGYLFSADETDDTFEAFVFAFLAIIYGFGTFGCAYSFIDNITSAIAEKSKRSNE